MTREAAYELNQGWLFGGVYTSGSADPDYDDSGFSRVTLPHTVVPLSWGGWDAAAWEKVWIYRRYLDGSLLGGGRVFADFGGIMVFVVRGKFGGTPAEDALTRLKTLVYGGTPVEEGEASDLLRSAGLTSVRPAPTPEGAPGVTIGQKPA
jgi:hypothetical protein